MSLAGRRVRVQDSPREIFRDLGKRSAAAVLTVRSYKGRSKPDPARFQVQDPPAGHAGLASCVVHSFVGGVAAPRSRALRHTACTHFPRVFATVGELALDQDIDVA